VFGYPRQTRARRDGKPISPIWRSRDHDNVLASQPPRAAVTPQENCGAAGTGASLRSYVSLRSNSRKTVSFFGWWFDL